MDVIFSVSVVRMQRNGCIGNMYVIILAFRLQKSWTGNIDVTNMVIRMQGSGYRGNMEVGCKEVDAVVTWTVSMHRRDAEATWMIACWLSG